ncbi:reverse transcriptase domain-containing protein [Tanacetum coccineum]
MYLATSEENVSAILMAERGKKQILVYFVSRTLNEAKLKYPELEKLILALVYAARKLRRYFQAHPIQVLNDKPIKQILVKPEKLGRIAKWAIELGEHEIEFKGRNSIKGQILADFLAETPLTKNKEAKNEEVKIKEPEPKNAWKLFTGGASSSDGSGAGPMQAKNIIKEVHEGSCGMHSGTTSVVSKITRLGYYWPSMHKDAKELIQKCEACQIYSSVPRKLKQEMTSITSAWPFSQWGIDIVGPMPTAPGGARFLVVAKDDFTKWVKAKPLISITGKHMKKFVWEHIVEVTNREIIKGMERSLVYGSEAVIPIEISVETKRVQDFDPKENEKRRREDLEKGDN